MTQPDVFQLAQRGDSAAIARWLNRSLQPRGVSAKVLLRDNCLKILLISSRPLDQTAFVQLIQRQINLLGLSAVKLVKVYSQETSASVPTWFCEFVPVAQRHSQTAVSSPDVPSPTTGAIVKYKPEAADFWQTLRTFQLDSVFPYRDVFSRELYRSNMVRLLLFLGVFPLLVNLLAEQASLAQVAWLIGIYYACIWGIVLYYLIRPVEFSWRNTLQCVLFTTFIGIPLLLLFQRVPPFNTLYHALSGGILFRLVGFIFGVGVLEEICKALPVYLLLVRPQKIKDPLTAAFYGAMSGLGFAIAEGAAYSLRYAFGLSRGQLGLGSYVAANTIRFVSLPLFHAILAGIVGYFMGLAVINPSRRNAILFIGVAIAAILHGLYNTFAGGIPALLIVGFTIVLFVSYLRRSQQLVDEMHRAEQRFRSVKGN
ncbi:MAG: PrsW family intramembrane metalloprotease [Synechococcales cyanobacterium C42_A2020_086]|jgi:RsiW-degrading membrane proteinase PrsW (M82 family)|nr:PrsW family intramembrane metalloprotease [Synechococcales cyanobacterium C42_A2020_086]